MKINNNKFIFFISLCGVMVSTPSYAEDYYPPGLLNLNVISGPVLTNEDIAIFNDTDYPPGEYDVNIYVNNNIVEKRVLKFVEIKDEQSKSLLEPCLSLQELAGLGIILPAEQNHQLEPESCVRFSQYPYVIARAELNRQALVLDVPQAYIDKIKLYELNESKWDEGIPAAMLDYSFSSFNQSRHGNWKNSYYGNIRSGMNFGAWRYRNYSVWNHNDSTGNQWSTISNNISRNIRSLKSELILGDVYSSARIFDSVKISGVSLATDEAMYPSEFTTYAPTVTGIASSEAILTITQNNSVIYKQSIPAGPFSIDNYYPMSSGGNLTVTVKESDGTEKTFIVPFSSTMNLVRKGQTRYHVSSGEYKSTHYNSGAYLNQGEVLYGITDYLTLFTGTQISQDYQAIAMGSALNLGSIGAVSSNFIYTSAKNDFDENKKGNSIQLNYAKRFTPTRTDFTLAGYRHFTKDYLTFQDAMMKRKTDDNYSYGVRNQYELTVAQPLPEYFGSVNLSAIVYKYSDGNKLSSYNVGYANSINKINYSVYYTYYSGKSYGVSASQNNYNVNFNMSVPFTIFDKRVWSNYSMSTNKDHQTNYTANLSSDYGEASQGTWNIYQGYGNKKVSTFGGMSSSYRASQAMLNGGYSYTKDSSNLNYGMSGSILATQYGVALGPDRRYTNALILTDGVEGIGQVNNRGARTVVVNENWPQF